jgi:hypothetical protein
MELRIRQGDRLVITAREKPPDISVRVFDVIEVVEAGGIRTALAQLRQRNDEQFSAGLLITITIDSAQEE